MFDIDGTLISTGGASDRAWHRAFLELQDVDVNVPDYTGKGVPDPQVGLPCFRGAIGREPERRGDGGADGAARAVPGRGGRELARLPGDARARSRRSSGCTGEGRLVGLITGNTEPAAHIKLARAGLNRFFAFGGYGSDANERVDVCRKALDRAEVAAGGELDRAGSIATGDTPLDVEAGHGAGIRVVGVATGEYSVEQLGEAGADWVVASLADRPLPF